MKYQVKIKSDGRIAEIESDTKLIDSDLVIVETEHGVEASYVMPEEKKKEEKNNENGNENAEKVEFIRKATEKDLDKLNNLGDEAKKYLDQCSEKIRKFKLPMQLVDADLSFDEKKLTFYFVAPERVDFRVLVSDLVHTFRKVIRLQQVGARDEARYLGGVGRCGQGLCCRKFLKGNLESVTLDMAYDQNLAQMGSNRVTGVCGKLMCCLKYELDDYKEAKEKMPKIGEKVKTEEGEGVVIAHSVLKKTYSVKTLDDKIVEVKWK